MEHQVRIVNEQLAGQRTAAQYQHDDSDDEQQNAQDREDFEDEEGNQANNVGVHAGEEDDLKRE